MRRKEAKRGPRRRRAVADGCLDHASCDETRVRTLTVRTKEGPRKVESALLKSQWFIAHVTLSLRVGPDPWPCETSVCPELPMRIIAEYNCRL